MPGAARQVPIKVVELVVVEHEDEVDADEAVLGPADAAAQPAETGNAYRHRLVGGEGAAAGQRHPAATLRDLHQQARVGPLILAMQGHFVPHGEARMLADCQNVHAHTPLPNQRLGR